MCLSAQKLKYTCEHAYSGKTQISYKGWKLTFEWDWYRKRFIMRTKRNQKKKDLYSDRLFEQSYTVHIECVRWCMQIRMDTLTCGKS